MNSCQRADSETAGEIESPSKDDGSVGLDLGGPPGEPSATAEAAERGHFTVGERLRRRLGSVPNLVPRRFSIGSVSDQQRRHSISPASSPAPTDTLEGAHSVYSGQTAFDFDAAKATAAPPDSDVPSTCSASLVGSFGAQTVTASWCITSEDSPHSPQAYWV